MNNSSLIINTTQYGFPFDLEVLPWDRGLTSYRVYSDGDKEELEGNLGVGFESFGLSIHDDWMKQIPIAALQNTYHFSEYQFYMLWIAANSSVALKILEEQPILIALICSDSRFEREEALTICSQGKKQILASLGLDSSKLALAFIDKLVFTFEYGHELTYVRKYLGKDKMHRRFEHYRTINDIALALDQSIPSLTGSKLSLHMSEQPFKNVKTKAAFVKKTLQLGESTHVINPLAEVKNCASYVELKALYSRWSEQPGDIVPIRRTAD